MEQDQLIAAIVADPDDETAWLGYADWLLEREHKRGELIQLGPLAKAGNNEGRWEIQRLSSTKIRYSAAPLRAESNGALASIAASSVSPNFRRTEKRLTRKPSPPFAPIRMQGC